MTESALAFKRTVTDILPAFVGDGRMALCAGYPGVSAFKGELRIAAVIESGRSPLGGRVAAGAVGSADGIRKLAAVKVLVACGASLLHGRKTQRRPIGAVGVLVAPDAGYSDVATVERIRRGAVVEADIAPVVLSMACRTALRNSEFCRSPLVGIAVAGSAGGRRIGERVSERRGRQLTTVTLVAGDREVGALQGEVGRRVLFEAEGRGAESLDGVALLTSSFALTAGERAVVEVAVAIATGRELQGSGGRSVAVALGAGDRGMAALKREAGAAVIKGGGVDDTPAVDRMTTGTRAGQTPLVGIAMAVGAERVGDRFVLAILQLRARLVGEETVAFFAGYCGVAAGKRKAAPGVVEAGGRTPAGVGVTGGAVSAELSAVFIGVAGVAGTTETEESTVGGYIGLFECRRTLQVVRAVALTARDGGVFAGERIARQGMVEGVHAALKVDQIEVAAMMFDMAKVAFRVIRASVQPLAAAALVGDWGVAGEAFLGELISLRAVAHAAVLDSLEGCMRAMQVPRRDLGCHRRCENGRGHKAPQQQV